MKEKNKEKGVAQIYLIITIIIATILISGSFLYSSGKLDYFFEKISQVSRKDTSTLDLTPTQESDEETQKRVAELEKQVEGLKDQQSQPTIPLPPKEQSDEKIKELENKIKEMGYSANSITQAFGRFIVKVVCIDPIGNETHGSGIIFLQERDKNETYILTNYHVVEDAFYIDDRAYAEPDKYVLYPCLVFYSPNPTIAYTDGYLAMPITSPNAIGDMQKYDYGILQIKEKSIYDPKTNTFTSTPNASLILEQKYDTPFCTEEDLYLVGKEVVALGYPTIGGKTMTATEGIISGFDGKSYLTTSAKIEQGNSGGGAFLKTKACLIGMPSFVYLGKIESMARLLNMTWFFNELLPNQ